MASERKVLFVFLDGVGLGEDDPAVNALAAARLPRLSALLGGRRPVLAAVGAGAAATLLGLDAVLGQPGLPQSGTGQTALLTGEDAPGLFGRHFGPWVPVALRRLVAEDSVLVRAVRAGRRVAFANAYPEELLEAIPAGAPSPGPPGAPPAGEPGQPQRAAAAASVPPDYARLPGPLRAGPPLAALGAGLLTRGTADLEQGLAISSEIVNDGWRERLRRRSVPAITSERAGENLAALAADHDLTFFGHYTTDAAGHHRELPPAVAAIERVDDFLTGLLHALPPDILLVLASDHGNIEDCRAGHTRNPALFLAAGPGHREFSAGLGALTDVTPRVLDWLGVLPGQRASFG